MHWITRRATPNPSAALRPSRPALRTERCIRGPYRTNAEVALKTHTIIEFPWAPHRLSAPAGGAVEFVEYISFANRAGARQDLPVHYTRAEQDPPTLAFVNSSAKTSTALLPPRRHRCAPEQPEYNPLYPGMRGRHDCPPLRRASDATTVYTPAFSIVSCSID